MSSQRQLQSSEDGQSSTSIPVINEPSFIAQEKKPSFFQSLRGDRRRILQYYARCYVIAIVVILALIGIYWGSIYRREDRFTKMKIAVVNWDGRDSDYLSANSLKPYVGNSVVNNLPSGVLGWEVRSDLVNSTFQDIRSLVHERYYWGAIVIKQNATESLHKALSSADPEGELTGIVEAIYEQATDLTATGSYLVPGFQTLKDIYERSVQSEVYAPLLTTLNSTQMTSLINHASNLLSPASHFVINDYLPCQSLTLLAPMQIGLMFMLIVSFFQFGLFISVHGSIARKIRRHQYILYRIGAAHITYFIFSLFFCLGSVAFQIDTSVAFGKSGFLVLWMATFLGMSALGGASENMALLITAYAPELLGFWLVLWAVSNLSPAFGPITLCPDFYRYGYAFPLYNILELERVVFCNTTKKLMGRCFGVLVAWVVVNNLLLPVTLTVNARRMAKGSKP